MSVNGHKILCGRSQGRYSSTNLKDARIEENRAISATSCQKKCQNHPECMFFLFFDTNHYQAFKHLTCRLLRSKGPSIIDIDQLSHSQIQIFPQLKTRTDRWCSSSCTATHKKKWLPFCSEQLQRQVMYQNAQIFKRNNWYHHYCTRHLQWKWHGCTSFWYCFLFQQSQIRQTADFDGAAIPPPIFSMALNNWCNFTNFHFADNPFKCGLL